MKITLPDPVSPGQTGWRNIHAMTFIEMMTTMGLFTILLTGMFTVFIFGQRYDQFVNSKIGATDLARMACQKLLRDIHGCKGVQVGTNYGGTNFVAIANNAAQIGTAIQLSYNTNWTTNLIEYYYDPTNQCLDRCTQGVSGYVVIANFITNTFRFSELSCTNGQLSNILTTIDNEPVVDVFMEFYQFQYPLTTIASNQIFDYYKLEFTATSRNYD
jgi:hypothetical protein